MIYRILAGSKSPRMEYTATQSSGREDSLTSGVGEGRGRTYRVVLVILIESIHTRKAIFAGCLGVLVDRSKQQRPFILAIRLDCLQR